MRRGPCSCPPHLAMFSAGGRSRPSRSRKQKRLTSGRWSWSVFDCSSAHRGGVNRPTHASCSWRLSQSSHNMSLATRRGPITCNCRKGCPAYTWALASYFITLLDGGGFPIGGYQGRLVTYPAVNTEFTECAFSAAVPLLPYVLEQLSFRQIATGVGLDGFAVRFDRSVPAGPTESWEEKVIYGLPTPIPIDPNSSISCSRVTWTLDPVFPTTSSFCLVEAAYPDACDHLDYPAKVQSPWHHLTPR